MENIHAYSNKNSLTTFYMLLKIFLRQIMLVFAISSTFHLSKFNNF